MYFFNSDNIIQDDDECNSDHPILGALFEKWRKEKDLNINTLAKEAHICTTTYGKIKKGWM